MQGERDVPKHLPDFGGGKVVVLYLAYSASGGVALTDLGFKWLGERLFVVGQTVGTENSDRRAGLESAVAWDAVTHYFVFPSVEDFAKRTAGGRVSLLSRPASS